MGNSTVDMLNSTVDMYERLIDWIVRSMGVPSRLLRRMVVDTRTGEIHTAKEIEKLREELTGNPKAMTVAEKLLSVIPMKVAPTAEQMARNPPQVKGHERCPCGSGKLFKNCHKGKLP